MQTQMSGLQSIKATPEPCLDAKSLKTECQIYESHATHIPNKQF